MIMLLTGLVAFTLLHMIPFFGQSLKNGVSAKVGNNAYRGIFSLFTLASIVLLVFGWQATDPENWLYTPPTWSLRVTPIVLYFAILLFIASNAPTNIRRLLRHPQLYGVILWGAGHLLANGELRSVLLFGGFIVFGLLSIWDSNKRDGEWIKRDKVPLSRDIVTVLIASIVYAALMYFHTNFTGIEVLPM